MRIKFVFRRVDIFILFFASTEKGTNIPTAVMNPAVPATFFINFRLPDLSVNKGITFYCIK